MRFIHVEQKSDGWHLLRKASIGSSDAPIIMGVSPWKTVQELWEEKTGRKKKKDFTSSSMQRGIDLEPVVRALVEFDTGLEFPSIVVGHSEYEFLIASLDGYNAMTNAILEIKCPGHKDHMLAENEVIPPKYVPQLQHQLLVTGAHFVRYVSYNGKKMASIEMKPDKNYLDELLNRELKFWDCVQRDIRPQEDF